MTFTVTGRYLTGDRNFSTQRLSDSEMTWRQDTFWLMYYISGYYIFGWEVATGNVMTENVIIYSGLASVLNNEVQTVSVFLVYDSIVSNHQIIRWEINVQQVPTCTIYITIILDNCLQRVEGILIQDRT